MTDLLRIEGLRTVFRTANGEVSAVDGVHLAVARGQTLGIVGESGCGKSVLSLSVLSLSVMRLVPRPGRIAAGFGAPQPVQREPRDRGGRLFRDGEN